MKFTVSVHKGDKYYIARVPELGVTTQGRTREEAKKNLREAIQVHQGNRRIRHEVRNSRNRKSTAGFLSEIPRSQAGLLQAGLGDCYFEIPCFTLDGISSRNHDI